MRIYVLLTLSILLSAGCDHGYINNQKTASNCYNKQLGLLGTEVRTTFTITENGIPLKNIHDNKIVQNVTIFEGVSNVSEIISFNQSGGTIGEKSFVKYNDTHKTILTLGSIENNVITVLKPNGIMRRMDIPMNETQYVPTVTFVKEGNEIGTLDMSYIFTGNEIISVPAGKFNTCIIKTTLDSIENGLKSTTVTTQYIGVDNSMTIKKKSITTLSNGKQITSMQQLVYATINGKAI